METETQKRATAAQYMREHRAMWKEAGFSTMTSMVHDADRQKLAAYMDLTKFERLLDLVENDDEQAIDLAATRNTPKMPTFDMVEQVKELANKAIMLKASKNNGEQALALMNRIRVYGEKHRTNASLAQNDPMNDKVKALTVIYGNLAVMTYKLAYALVRYSPNIGDHADD